MPVKELTQLLKSYGVSVVIDGAHAAGQLPNLNVPDIGADFYAGTCVRVGLLYIILFIYVHEIMV